MEFLEVFRSHYRGEIQLSVFQLQTIAAAIVSRSPNCNLLVFGVGFDSKLLMKFNSLGATHFMEHDFNWIDRARLQMPEIAVSLMPTYELSVESSNLLDPNELREKFKPPRELADIKWDVIIVDAPPGNGPRDPGRAIAISWASQLGTEKTHIFVDDYERPLETRYTDALIKNRRKNPWSVIFASTDAPHRLLFWSIGNPLGD